MSALAFANRHSGIAGDSRSALDFFGKSDGPVEGGLPGPPRARGRAVRRGIPCAVTERRVEVSSESAAMIASASARPSARLNRWSGDQPPVASVIAQAAK